MSLEPEEDELLLLERIRRVREIGGANCSYQSGVEQDESVKLARYATEKLLARHVPWLSRLCLVEAGNDAQGKDCLQEVLIEIAKALPSFAGKSALKTWMFVIARRVVRRTLARARRAERTNDIAEGAGVSLLASPEESYSVAEERAELLAAVSKLPSQQRYSVIFHYFEDLTVDETAERLGCSSSAVKTHLQRARNSLAGRLRK